jgi:hypothetical protein
VTDLIYVHSRDALGADNVLQAPICCRHHQAQRGLFVGRSRLDLSIRVCTFTPCNSAQGAHLDPPDVINVGVPCAIG